MFEGCAAFPYGRFWLARAGDGKVELPRGDGDDGGTTTMGRSSGVIRHLPEFDQWMITLRMTEVAKGSVGGDGELISKKFKR